MISPEEVTLAAGARQTFTADAADYCGNKVSVPNVRWSASHGTFGADGTFTVPAGTESGAAITIIAEYQNLTSSLWFSCNSPVPTANSHLCLPAPVAVCAWWHATAGGGVAMPELPEMETYRRLLEQHCQRQVIVQAEVGRAKSLNLPAADFAQAVQGTACTGFGRAGKHLIFTLANGLCLLNHLMLDGALFYSTAAEAPARTRQVVLHLGNGRALWWTGLRLGWLHLVSTAELAQRLAGLGLDPLAGGFTPEHLAHLLQGRRGRLKAFLTDQRFCPGVGNCYADEICWAAQLHPLRRAGALPPPEQFRLWQALRQTLAAAVDLGGYTETPFMPGDGLSGGYLPHLQVYDRAGEPCRRCGAGIALTVVSGRKVFCCPVCQPAGD